MEQMLTYICPKCGVRWKIVPASKDAEIMKNCPNCIKETVNE